MASENYDRFFLDDMADLLADATMILEEAEKQKRWESAIPFLFRTFHSLKGAAPMAGMVELGKFLHQLEDLLAAAQKGQLVMDTKWGDFLLNSIDIMYEELEAARQGESLLTFSEKYKEMMMNLPNHHKEELQKTVETPVSIDLDSSGQTVTVTRLMILCFVLVKAPQMPEVAALVLEKQYGEVGQVQSMVLARDGDQRVIVGVIETALSSNELKKVAAVAEVAEIYVQPFFARDCTPLESNSEIKKTQMQARILLVEDDIDLLMLMCKVLEKRGYSTVAVTTAEEALQLIQSEKFHIIITDISLPGLNGIEMVRLIRQRDPLIQVIVMTGLSAMQNAIEALELGVSEYLVKPLVNMGELIKAIEVCEGKLAQWWLQMQKLNEKRG